MLQKNWEWPWKQLEEWVINPKCHCSTRTSIHCWGHSANGWNVSFTYGFKKQGRSLLNKTLIVGIYEKTTNNLIVKVLKNANSKNLLQFAINHISSKCDVHTDSWKGYRDLKSVFTKHETVNHQDGYVSKTGVNTNQIESVWKHIRRTFKTHIKVAKHHIHLYAKEAAYKFNNIPSFETVMLCLI